MEGAKHSLTTTYPFMKSVFKKNQPKNATNYNSTRGFAVEGQHKDNAINELLYQRIGKSRQEIFDFMKILKTF